MQIFELHFNPKLNEDRLFESFVYEPSNIYERKLGSLFAVGELKNALPQNANLLDILAKIIKGKYFTLSFRSPEKAISESLKKTNEFLQEEVKKDNVNWLGNLNFAILSIKDFELIFTKTGEIKLLLLRGGQIIDMGKNLALEEIEPYPLKIFLHIVAGKLATNDIILILTKDVYDFFSKEDILRKFAQSEFLDEKKLKEIIPSSLFSKKDGSNVSGICLAISLTEKLSTKSQEFLFQKEKRFSFPHPFLFLKKSLKSLTSKFRQPKITTRFFKKLKKKPKKKKIPRKKFKIKFPSFAKNLSINPATKKKIVLILVLLFLLLVGILIF